MINDKSRGLTTEDMTGHGFEWSDIRQTYINKELCLTYNVEFLRRFNVENFEYHMRVTRNRMRISFGPVDLNLLVKFAREAIA